MQNNAKQNGELLFGRSASRYDRYARMQAEVSRRLVQHMPEYHDYGTILDIGCGTGITGAALTEAPLRYSRMFGLDLSRPMCRRYCSVTGNACVQADMSTLPFKKSVFHTVVSAMAMHWLPPAQHDNMFEHIARICAPNANVHIAIPVVGTLLRFRKMLDEASGGTLRHMDFPDPDMFMCAMSKHMRVTTTAVEPYKEYFTQPLDMLRYTKHIGANITGRATDSRYPGKAIFTRFSDIFYALSDSEKALDWRILYIRAVTPA